jgi:hypothetical protein
MGFNRRGNHKSIASMFKPKRQTRPNAHTVYQRVGSKIPYTQWKRMLVREAKGDEDTFYALLESLDRKANRTRSKNYVSGCIKDGIEKALPKMMEDVWSEHPNLSRTDIFDRVTDTLITQVSEALDKFRPSDARDKYRLSEARDCDMDVEVVERPSTKSVSTEPRKRSWLW